MAITVKCPACGTRYKNGVAFSCMKCGAAIDTRDPASALLAKQRGARYDRMYLIAFGVLLSLIGGCILYAKGCEWQRELARSENERDLSDRPSPGVVLHDLIPAVSFDPVVRDQGKFERRFFLFSVHKGKFLAIKRDEDSFFKNRERLRERDIATCLEGARTAVFVKNEQEEVLPRKREYRRNGLGAQAWEKEWQPLAKGQRLDHLPPGTFEIRDIEPKYRFRVTICLVDLQQPKRRHVTWAVSLPPEISSITMVEGERVNEHYVGCDVLLEILLKRSLGE